MIESSLCVLFFPMYFLVLTQKTEANFQILQFQLLKLQILFCFEGGGEGGGGREGGVDFYGDRGC